MMFDRYCFPSTLRSIALLLLFPSLTEGQVCTDVFRQECVQSMEQCEPCFSGDPAVSYNCSLPGLTTLTPGQYEGVTANYLSFVTELSSPNMLLRAREFEACTGGSIVFSEAANVWEDPITDLGTKTSRGTEFYDGYFMSYSHFPEASALDLAEHLNDRIRATNARLKWEDVLPKVKAMGAYRKNGKTNVDFLMYDGDFFVPLIRLDLLEKHNLPMPNTWPEVVEYAKFFNNTDLNGDGEMDFGFCHFPRVGAGKWDWWASEIFYSIWATFDQTHGMNQGFYFDEDTMEPRVNSPGFKEAAKIWKELWALGTDTLSGTFKTGGCAIGFGPPGEWKGVFLNPDGVHREDENGTVLWQPTLSNGEYAEPRRIKPFGTTQVVDRNTGKLTNCTPSICPKAEAVPSQDVSDRISILKPSPLEGKLVNRAPFYWSGGLGTLIRKSATEVNKDLMWDFFVYTNSPETAVYDVANYASWLDSWRYTQLLPGNNFIEAGWSHTSYEEHAAIMQWALSADVNGALNLRIPGMAKYTRDVIGDNMGKYIGGSISFEQLVNDVTKGWNDITLQQGKLDQLEIYRAGLGLDSHSEVELCRLHRELMDERDPSICRQYDAETDSQTLLLVAILVPSLIALFAIFILYYTDKKRRAADKLWTIKLDELSFQAPPEVLGRGTFGLVVLAEYRGTNVAVKRAIAPKKHASGANNHNSIFGSGCALKDDLTRKWKSNHQQRKTRSEGKVEHALETVNENSREDSVLDAGDEETGSYLPSEMRSSTLEDNSNGSTGAPSTHRRGLFDRFKRRGDEYTEFVAEMRHLSRLRHSCITTVMGAVIDKGQEPMLVMEFVDHGSLYDILHNKSIPLDGAVLLPILQDIAQGARFLHEADPAVIHGDLKSQNVLIDPRLRAKVTDFGISGKKRSGARGSPQWMAPELLRRETTINTAASDVYSFGILLWECYSRMTPYEGEEICQVLRDVADPKIEKRPAVPPACPPKLAAIMTDCLEGEPDLRPRFDEIDLRLKRLDSSDAEPDETLLPSWARRNVVAAKGENRLFEVFPQHVAEALRDGHKVEPEKYDCVTIFLSEIVSFADIAETQTPEQVSDMLKRLYLSFDELCQKHDVFKVETVGETYMCVTNMAKDQEEDHALRIADFSADAVKAASETPVNTEDESLGFLQIRVGLHSGPVISRVVGSRGPKFCVFGDTVNTASIMESTSLPGRVQCTEGSANLLREQSPGIGLLPRGKIAVKGKGELSAFLLPN